MELSNFATLAEARAHVETFPESIDWILGGYFDPDESLLYLMTYGAQIRVYRVS